MKLTKLEKPYITKREKEIIWHIAYGLNSIAIGKKLFISNQTVETHRKNIMGKMVVSNTAGMIRRSFELGVLKLNERKETVLNIEAKELRYLIKYA